MVYWGYNHLLTIDPNFQRDIQVGFFLGGFVFILLFCIDGGGIWKPKNQGIIFVNFLYVIKFLKEYDCVGGMSFVKPTSIN